MVLVMPLVVQARNNVLVVGMLLLSMADGFAKEQKLSRLHVKTLLALSLAKCLRGRRMEIAL